MIKLLATLMFAFFVASAMARAETMPWLTDPSEAFSVAKAQKKQLLVDVYAQWCPPCNYLNEHVFTNAAVIDLAKEFVLLKVDADASASYDFKSTYKITAYPTILFLNAQAQEQGRLLGSLPAKDFLALMQSYRQKGDIPTLLSSLQKDTALQDRLIALAHDFEGKGMYAEAITTYRSLALFFGNTHPAYIDGLFAELTQLPQKDQEECFTVAKEILERTKDTSRYPLAAGAAFECIPDKPTDGEDPARIKEGLERLAARMIAYKQLGTLSADDRIYANDVLVQIYDRQGDAKNLQLTRNENIGIRESLLAKTPGSKSILLDLLYDYLQGGYYDKAEKHIIAMRAKEPDSYLFYYQYAKVLLKKGDYTTALEQVEQALKRSYGDNKLFCIILKADILEKRDKTALRTFLDQEYKAATVDKNLQVRSHRYLKRIEDRMKALESP